MISSSVSEPDTHHANKIAPRARDFNPAFTEFAPVLMATLKIRLILTDSSHTEQPNHNDWLLLVQKLEHIQVCAFAACLSKVPLYYTVWCPQLANVLIARYQQFSPRCRIADVPYAHNILPPLTPEAFERQSLFRLC